MSANENEAAALCRACNLCCDGNLFAQVPLAADEADRARRRALVVVDRDDGSPALRQRCAALTVDGCAHYDERPAGCRRYRCMLLAALADDEVSLPAALTVVAETHALLAAAAAAVPPGPGAPLQRAREAARAGTLSPAAGAAVHAARVFLGRHFDRGAGPR